MNKKGQIGPLVMAFITIIVGIALLVAVSTEVSNSTTTATNLNVTQTTFTENLTVELEGRGFLTIINIGNVTVQATTNTDEDDFGENFSMFTAQKAGNDGLTVKFRVNPGAVNHPDGDAYNISWNAVNVSYTFEPDGYFSNGGSRTIFNLILLFLAIAVMVIVLPILQKSGIFEGKV